MCNNPIKITNKRKLGEIVAEYLAVKSDSSIYCLLINKK